MKKLIVLLFPILIGFALCISPHVKEILNTPESGFSIEYNSKK